MNINFKLAESLLSLLELNSDPYTESEVFKNLINKVNSLGINDKNTSTAGRYDKIAFLLISDGIYFRGFERWLYKFLREGPNLPDEKKPNLFSSSPYIYVEKLRIPISIKTSQFLQNFFQAPRKFKKTFTPSLRGAAGLMNLKVKDFKILALSHQRLFSCEILTEMLENYNYVEFLNTEKYQLRGYKLRSLIVNKDYENNLDLINKCLNEISKKNIPDFEVYELLEPFFKILKNNDIPELSTRKFINYLYRNYELFDLALGDIELDESDQLIINELSLLSDYPQLLDILKKSPINKKWHKVLPKIDTLKDKVYFSNSYKIRENEYLSINEIESLLNVEEDEYFFYFCLLLFTGMRPAMPFELNLYKIQVFIERHFIRFKSAKTEQYHNRDLSLLIPQKYLRRFIKIWNSDNSLSFMKSLNRKDCEQKFKAITLKTKIYLTRKTFINHLAIAFAQLNNNPHFISGDLSNLKSYFTDGKNLFNDIEDQSITQRNFNTLKDIITSKNLDQIQNSLDQLLVTLGEILGHSTNSTVLFHNYINSKILLFLFSEDN